ncbi:MAG: hypothetical protein AAB368_04315, partial [bacterium]
AGTGLLVAALAGAGSVAGRWTRAGGPGESRAHVMWLAGLAAGSMIVLGLGLTGLIRPPLLWSLLAFGVAAAIPMLIRQARAWRLVRREPGRPTPLAAACLAFALAGAAIALFAALAPQIWYDALQYYYVAPRRALAHHWYLCEAGVPSDGYPHGFELLYIPAFLLGGEPGAMLLTGLELALTAAALGGLLREAGAGREARALAQALFWTLPFTGQLPHLSYSDAAVMHGAAVGLWLLRRGEARSAALVGGWLRSLKSTAVIPAVPLWLAAVGRRRAAWRTAAIAALACAGPWLVRNMLGHGSALYPMLAGLQETFDTPVTMPSVFDLQSAVPSSGFAGSVAGFLGGAWRTHAGGDVSGFASFGVLWLFPLAVALAGGETALLLGTALASWLVLGKATLRYFEPAIVWTLAGALGGLERKRALRVAALPGLAFCALGLLDGLAQGYRGVNPVAVVTGAERERHLVNELLEYLD